MIEKTCPHCGTRLSSYYKTGMLGCARCYDAFKGEITSSLEKFQMKSFHVGKTPKCSEEDKNLLGEYRRLLAEKERLGIEGKFSEMASVSKEIFAIAEELKKRGLI